MASKRIIWAGRFTHAKGRLGMKLASEIFPIFKDTHFEIYAGPLPCSEITEANENVKFFGVVHDLIDRMKNADLVIGGGRVALEAMSIGIPVMAVGQRCYVGIIDNDNIKYAKETNFGDMHRREFIDYPRLTKDLSSYVFNENTPNTSHYSEFLEEYKLDAVVCEIQSVYEQAIISVDK